jgi:integrase/recombinase XerD
MPKDFLHQEKPLQDNPLELHLRTFTTWLTGEGYAQETVQKKLRLLVDLGKWLRGTGRAVSNLDEQVLEAFTEHQRRVHRGDLRTFAQFLDHLRERDVVPNRKLVPDQSPLAELLIEYEKYLRSERGLMAATISHYQHFVRKFLVERFPRGSFLLKEVEASDISAFVLRHGRSRSVKSTQLMTTALRSFFRYVFERGKLRADLAASVPAVSIPRLFSVPRYMSPEGVECVLKGCNCRTAIGRRDYAILLLLARLGLRAGEVAALQLDDINWRAGEILVRGKGLLHDRMPLPADVGEALASYLRRDRPACQTRRVFVRAKAPCRGFACSQAVSWIVRRALDRVNLHPNLKGAHLFRHSLATSMLRSGATMGEIGEVLRHRNPNTTDIYAKVDFEGLRSVAHSWPMGGAQ